MWKFIIGGLLFLQSLSALLVKAQEDRDRSPVSKLDSQLLSPLYWKHESGLGPALSIGMTSFDGIPALNASFKFPV